MRNPRGRPMALSGLLLLATSVLALADSIIAPPEMARGSGIEIKLRSYYEEIPPYGFLPVQVTIKNSSSAARTWKLEADSTQDSTQRTSYTTNLRVEAGTEKIFDVMVPLQPQLTTYRRYSTVTIQISGYGVASHRNGILNSSSRGSNATPFLGLGEELATKRWGELKAELDKKKSKSLDGTSLDPSLLPDDWRALAGFSNLIFTEEEWRKVAASSKEAIRDWVAQGGELVLQAADTATDLPAKGAYGSGTIERWSPGDDFVQRATLMLEAGDKAPIPVGVPAYDQKSRMAEQIGTFEPPQALILGFVIIFGTIIGPVNFLMLAPADRRHRLFWTTPLIAIAASGLLGAYILLSEGFGGSGLRGEAVLSLPNEHKEILWQEQVSRTGILTQDAFRLSEPALALPLSLRDRAPRREGGAQFALTGETWTGDWFRNRSTQGQLLVAAAPTRGRLEIAADASGGPIAISSFQQKLEECWYLDEAGNAWKATDLSPGEKKKMASAQKNDFHRQWEAALGKTGPVITAAGRDFAEGTPKGRFFATTHALPQGIATLKAIRWKDEGGLIFGVPAK